MVNKVARSTYIYGVPHGEVFGILQGFGSLSELGCRIRRAAVSGIGQCDGIETNALTRKISDVRQVGLQTTTTAFSSHTVLSGGKVVSRPAGQGTGSSEYVVVCEGEKHRERCQFGECSRGEHVDREMG
jgi:hypothetical protein